MHFFEAGSSSKQLLFQKENFFRSKIFIENSQSFLKINSV